MDDREYAEVLRHTMAKLTENVATPTEIDAILAAYDVPRVDLFSPRVERLP